MMIFSLSVLVGGKVQQQAKGISLPYSYTLTIILYKTIIELYIYTVAVEAPKAAEET